MEYDASLRKSEDSPQKWCWSQILKNKQNLPDEWEQERIFQEMEWCEWTIAEECGSRVHGELCLKYEVQRGWEKMRMEEKTGYALEVNLVSVDEGFGFYLVRNGEPLKNCNRGSCTIWLWVFYFLLAAS